MEQAALYTPSQEHQTFQIRLYNIHMKTHCEKLSSTNTHTCYKQSCGYTLIPLIHSKDPSVNGTGLFYIIPALTCN